MTTTPALRRSVTLPGLVLYGLGTTIGAGIYALTGVVAGRAGMGAPLAFLLAALLAAFTAFSFAELSARFPRAGGEAVYVREGFGWLWLSTLVGLLIALAGIVSAAAVAVGFVGYLGDLVTVPRLPVLAGVVLAVGAVAAWGVRESVAAASLMTLIEIGGLLLVIGTGREGFAELPGRLSEFAAAATPGALTDLASAGVLAFYAFLGFEDMVNVAEEVRDVRKTLPRAILLTLGITTVLYVVVATLAVLIVPVDALARSDAPLALVYESAGGQREVLGLIALFAMLNGALVQVIKASRVLYGMACQGSLPSLLGRVHPRRRTPVLATGVATAGILVLALGFDLASLATLTSLITLGTFALANLALVLLKVRTSQPPGVFEVPLFVPAVGFAVSFGLAGFELIRLAG
jgi:APA family basic amino acid/polyamine antiporter